MIEKNSFAIKKKTSFFKKGNVIIKGEFLQKVAWSKSEKFRD